MSITGVEFAERVRRLMGTTPVAGMADSPEKRAIMNHPIPCTCTQEIINRDDPNCPAHKEERSKAITAMIVAQW